MYIRIVHPTEKVHDVLLEAIKNCCYVWCNFKDRKTVISRDKPKGDYEKMRG
jgi:hypothetical protein